MESIDCYEPDRILRGFDDLSWMPKSKYLVIQEKRAKIRELDAEITNYQKKTLRLNICEFFTGTPAANHVLPKAAWWEHWLTYSTWEWVIIIVTVILSVIAFISSLIHIWPELPKIFGGLVSTAYAAEPTKLPNSSWNYINIKDFAITLFVMILCLYSAFVCYYSKVESQRKFGRDTVKFILGFLSGRGMR